MSNVTRRALRVYSALSGLRATNEDVLDALIPFFEPILEVMDGKIFDPVLFASGVRRLYKWRFTKDIAEQFIPRLQKKKYLERKGQARDGIYIVHYARPNSGSVDPSLTVILEKIIDRFEQFPPRVTDLLNYKRSRDELIDILIRFLVSIDAYRDTSFSIGLDRLNLENESKTLLTQIEEGGTPLAHDDRYMCARFVKELCKTEPEFVPNLTKLASIGLLTEVVEDFVRPVAPAVKVDLTIAVDAPLALDFLGCSGVALQEDVKSIFESLRAIGCTFIVFPTTCEEITRNLKSMLGLPAPLRHGYTHDAIISREVMLDYVISVSDDPEKALSRVGIQVRSLDRQQYPNSHSYFNNERYEDFFASINWVAEVAPREHDATCMTLVMRLRGGKHSGDIFRCGYVLVTRNTTFVRSSRKYCLESHLINSLQEGPVIHQRELATVAWLRTGLGADDKIPRGHLLATCERVLMVRPELTAAVSEKLRDATPDKLEQYELLLQDYRSVRKLADETLNDESVVTAENAVRLLESMRQATIAAERQKFETKLEEERTRSRNQRLKLQDQASQAIADRDEARYAIAKRKLADQAAIVSIIARQNQIFKRSERGFIGLLLAMGVTGVIQYMTGWYSDSQIWTTILAIAGILGLYHFFCDVLEKPKIGLATILDRLSRSALKRKLAHHGLLEMFDFSSVEFNSGQIRQK